MTMAVTLPTRSSILSWLDFPAVSGAGLARLAEWGRFYLRFAKTRLGSGPVPPLASTDPRSSHCSWWYPSRWCLQGARSGLS